MTALELWAEAWPEVPWEEASAQDKRMYLDHAASLGMWRENRALLGL